MRRCHGIKLCAHVRWASGSIDVCKPTPSCRTQHLKYRLTQAFVFAVTEINNNKELLPNITLGFHIMDSCSAEERAMMGMFEILYGTLFPVPNYCSGNVPSLVGFIDGISSKVSLLLARMFGFYKVPQISYSSMDPELSDKIQFPSFYRTVPNEITQYQAIIKLIMKFGWSWIGILVSDNEPGLKASQILQRGLTESGGCVAFLEFIPYHDASNEKIRDKILNALLNSSPDAIVLYGDREYMLTLQLILYQFPVSEKLHKYLKDVHFTNSAGADVHFDESGDMNSEFDILNWIVYPNQTLNAIKVGRSEQRDSVQQVVIDEHLIRWSPYFNQTPQSTCKATCLPGYRKSPKEGQMACCYDCVPCPEGEISNQTNMETCLKCPEDKWPNINKDACIHKTIMYLSYEEPLGISLATVSVLLFLFTCLVMGVFTKHRNTPIVRANNQSLSFILLFSLKACFLCTLIFIGHPLRVTCILRQTVFGITFTISVSSILAKTVTVFVAFKATKPNSKLRNWVGSMISNLIVIFCSLVQVIICVLWLGISPPFPSYNMTDEVDKIIAQCNEGSVVGFYCVLGYMGFLAILSFMIAFLVRNLPDIFNEAKFITFSMLMFCSVWITFILAYLSTKGKNMVTVEVFAILASSTGLLVCIFVPKCYIILIRPERNTRVFISIKGNAN
ncbi:vomeronasal type-2 receptor 26-like [Spea bombifrons]|uniref:vomeronasal type-2 receptor 26-like n=1 Tax=Spea bombifrons TaxID=233779 RepID=UPI00234A3F5B|nr:vomeronasal type-2 receptor 26-like [Spea bombifrons]